MDSYAQSTLHGGQQAQCEKAVLLAVPFCDVMGIVESGWFARAYLVMFQLLSALVELPSGRVERMANC